MTPDWLIERPPVSSGVIFQDVTSPPVAVGEMDIGCPSEKVKSESP